MEENLKKYGYICVHIYIHIHRIESLWCIPEASTILQINCISIKNFQNEKKNLIFKTKRNTVIVIIAEYYYLAI